MSTATSENGARGATRPTLTREKRTIRASWEKLMVTPDLVSDAESCAGLIANMRHLAQLESWEWREILKLSEEYFERENRSTPTFNKIAIIRTMVAELFRVQLSTMKGRPRTEKNAWPRQVAMTLSYQLVEGATFVTVGKEFKRNWGTVRHAVKAVQDRCACEPEAKTQFERVKSAVEYNLLDGR